MFDFLYGPQLQLGDEACQLLERADTLADDMHHDVRDSLHILGVIAMSDNAEDAVPRHTLWAMDVPTDKVSRALSSVFVSYNESPKMSYRTRAYERALRLAPLFAQQRLANHPSQKAEVMVIDLLMAVLYSGSVELDTATGRYKGELVPVQA